METTLETTPKTVLVGCLIGIPVGIAALVGGLYLFADWEHAPFFATVFSFVVAALLGKIVVRTSPAFEKLQAKLRAKKTPKK